MRAKSKRDRRSWWLLLLAAGLVASGCGGDDDSTGGETSAATTAAGSETLADVQSALSSAGYTVEESEPEALLRRDDGEIVQPDGKLDVSGNDLTGRVSVYSLASTKDVEAMAAFAGGDVSLVRGSFFFQSEEPGEALTVADASGVPE